MAVPPPGRRRRNVEAFLDANILLYAASKDPVDAASGERYQLRYWDAAIGAGALRLGAPLLYSVDLNDGQTYDCVKAVNPFGKN